MYTIATGKNTILVVDDDEDVLDSVSELLELLGYAVHLAESGEKSLDLYKELGEEIDVVLLDLTLPQMTGKEVYDQLRTINPAVRIVLSTGYDKSAINGFSTESGRTCFLQKPYSITQIEEILSSILEE